MAGAPPSGTVTLLFTDIEGSTSLWNEHPAEMATAVARHDEIIGGVVEAQDGYVFTTAGDSFAVAFGSAEAAAAAAAEIQRALADEPWPEPATVRVRIGLHTGEATERGGDYFGPTVNLAARISDAAHGGQVVASRVTADLSGARVDREFGFHVLKGFGDPVEIVQLGSGDFAELRTQRAFRLTLPERRTPLVGRRADLDQIARSVDDRRLVTITGSGGVGKTSLAVEAARARSSSHSGGTHFVDLAPISDDGAIDGAIAAGIGLVPTGDQPVAEQVRRHIGSRDMLVVLDNCEHLVDAVADRVDALLTTCPSVSVLATSREALDVEGEHVVRVRSLDWAAADSPAVELFSERAAAAGVQLAADDDAVEIVRRICARLDGLPLAIELAAARTTMLTPVQLLDHLDDRFALLTAGRRRTRGRQQTLEATIAWSFDLLSDDERGVLCDVAVFPSTFDLDGAAAVTGRSVVDALELVDSLVAKSLVHTDASNPGKEAQYRLLESVRVYGWSQLLESGGESAATLGRYVRLVADAIDRPGADPYGFGRLLPWMADIRPAIHAAFELDHHEDVARILSWTFPFWVVVGDLDEGRELLGRASDLVGGEQRARILVALAHVQNLRLRLTSAMLYAHEALQTDTGDELLGHTLAHLHLAEFFQTADGFLEQSDLHLLRAVANLDHFPDWTALQRYLDYQLAKRAYDRGDAMASLEHHRRAIGEHSLIEPIATAGELVALLLLDDTDALRSHLRDPAQHARRTEFRRRALDGEMQAGGVEVAALLGDDRLEPGSGRQGLAALYEQHGRDGVPYPAAAEIAIGLAELAARRGDDEAVVALLADTFVGVACGSLQQLGYRLVGEPRGWTDVDRAQRIASEIARRLEVVRTEEWLTTDGRIDTAAAAMDERARAAVEAELARDV